MANYLLIVPGIADPFELSLYLLFEYSKDTDWEAVEEGERIMEEKGYEFRGAALHEIAKKIVHTW